MRFIKTEKQICQVCNNEQFLTVCVGKDFEYETCSNEFKYVECTKCSHIYLKNRPNKEELSTIYPKSYSNYQKSREHTIAFRMKKFLDKLSFKHVISKAHSLESILDVGCADGQVLDIFKEKSVKNLEGVEIEKYAGQVAENKGYNVIYGSIDDIDIKKNNYDLIILQQVIEHVFSPYDVLKKLYDSLNYGGILTIETPTSECLDLKLFKSRYWGGFHIPRHFNIFNEKNMVIMLEQIGFKFIFSRYKPQPGHWIWSIHHLLSERPVFKKISSFFYMTNPILLVIFTILEIILKIFTGKTSNMQIVVQKV